MARRTHSGGTPWAHHTGCCRGVGGCCSVDRQHGCKRLLRNYIGHNYIRLVRIYIGHNYIRLVLNEVEAGAAVGNHLAQQCQRALHEITVVNALGPHDRTLCARMHVRACTFVRMCARAQPRSVPVRSGGAGNPQGIRHPQHPRHRGQTTTQEYSHRSAANACKETRL